MTTERLEELVQWAIDESEDYACEGLSEKSKHMHDLARCARAWAVVARCPDPSLHRIHITGDRWSWVFTEDALNAYLSPIGSAGTPIEAVEAAEAGK